MNRRRFVLLSTVALVVAAAAVGGLAIYSNYVVSAANAGLPASLDYLPATSKAVFGMNVEKFVASPGYARLEQKHGKTIANDLADFIAKTGVDPRRDLHYLIAAGSPEPDHRGSGVAIAVGKFNTAGITTYIYNKTTPVKIEYRGATVLLIEEGSRVDKGIVFLSESEIALGDLDSLKTVLDVRDKAAPGIMTNTTLAPLLRQLNPDEMFWFAGDAGTILAKAPKTGRFGDVASSIQDVAGTLNIDEAVSGKIVATARDEESARKLADIARGLVALGQLAGDYDAKVSELMKGVSVSQDKTRITLKVNFDLNLLEDLDRARLPNPARKVV
jgi:hypothetical protein